MKKQVPIPKWPPPEKATPRKLEPMKGTPLANRIKNFQQDDRSVAPTPTQQKQPSLADTKQPILPTRVSSPEYEPRFEETQLDSESEGSGDGCLGLDEALEHEGVPVVKAQVVEDGQKYLDERFSPESTPPPGTKSHIASSADEREGNFTDNVTNALATEDDEEELFSRWATDPVSQSVRNLRATYHPGLNEDKRHGVERDYNRDGVHERHGDICDPEELYHRLDRLYATHGGRAGKGYTIDEIINYEEEEEKDRTERILWISGGVVVVVIAVLLAAWGFGWKVPFLSWGGPQSSEYGYIPHRVPEVPLRSKVATRSKGGQRILGKLFAATGLGYLAKRMRAEKTTWEKIKSGEFRMNDLKGLLGRAEMFGKKKKGWW